MDNDDVNDDLKARIQELEDELQKLKEKKEREGTDSAAVDEEIEEVHDQIRDEADQAGMSRRKFMKAIAGGGAALGAAAMMPSAAALDIESNDPLSYNNNFSVDTQGNLNLQGNNITNAGSVEASYLDSEEARLKGNTTAPDTQDAVVAPRLSDPIYPLSKYEDVFDAINAAISDMDSQFNQGSPVYLPTSLSKGKKITSGKITFPISLDPQPSIVGPRHSRRPITMSIGSSYPDNVAIDTELSGDDTTGEFQLSNFAIFDTSGNLTKFLDLTNRSDGQLTNLHFFANHNNVDVMVDIDQTSNGGDDFWYLNNLKMSGCRPGVRGFRYRAGQLWGEAVQVSGTDISGSGPLLDLGGTSVGNFIQAWVGGNSQTAIRVRSQNNGGRSGWGTIMCRVEAINNSHKTPYKIEDNGGVNLIVLDAPDTHWKHAVDQGAFTNWVTNHVRKIDNASISAGGVSVPPYYDNPKGTVSAANGKVNLSGASGSDARLDMGGNAPVTGIGSAADFIEFAPKFTAKVDVANSSVDADYRVGLVESAFEDWAGVKYDYSTQTYHIIIAENGTKLKDIDTGVNRSGQGEWITVKYAMGPRVAVSFGPETGNSPEPTFTTADLSSAPASVEPMFDIENNTSGSSALLEIYDVNMWKGLAQ